MWKWEVRRTEEVVWGSPLIPISATARLVSHLPPFRADDKSWPLEECPLSLTMFGFTCILSFNLPNKTRRLVLSTLLSRWELRSREISHQRHREAKSSALISQLAEIWTQLFWLQSPQFKLCTILEAYIAEEHPPCAPQAAVATWLQLGGLSFLVPSSTPPVFCLPVRRVAERHERWSKGFVGCVRERMSLLSSVVLPRLV